jgi:hypothetical protein
MSWSTTKRSPAGQRPPTRRASQPSSLLGSARAEAFGQFQYPTPPLSRSRDGIHKLIDVETARDIAERLSDLNEAIKNNEGISGPAAQRLMDAAAREHHRFGGIITTHRQARALLDDPGLTVFENQRAFLLCNYARDKALCHTSRANVDTPSLDRCQPRCANIARTDHHAAQT